MCVFRGQGQQFVFSDACIKWGLGRGPEKRHVNNAMALGQVQTDLSLRISHGSDHMSPRSSETLSAELASLTGRCAGACVPRCLRRWPCEGPPRSVPGIPPNTAPAGILPEHHASPRARRARARHTWLMVMLAASSSFFVSLKTLSWDRDSSDWSPALVFYYILNNGNGNGTEKLLASTEFKCFVLIMQKGKS